MKEKIYQVFKSHNGFARTKDILATGIHHRKINELLASGEIERIKGGLYRLTSMPMVFNQGFVDTSKAVPEGVICLTSALSFYELTTFNPSVISMALPRDTWKPQIEYPPVDFYFFSKKIFDVGIAKINIENHKVRIYDMEKTICDCFRYRNKIGIDIAKEALSEYLKRKDRNLEKLLSYAEICRVKSIIETWLQAMV